MTTRKINCLNYTAYLKIKRRKVAPLQTLCLLKQTFCKFNLNLHSLKNIAT